MLFEIDSKKIKATRKAVDDLSQAFFGANLQARALLNTLQEIEKLQLNKGGTNAENNFNK